MKNDGEQLRDDARQEEPQPDPVFEGRVSPRRQFRLEGSDAAPVRSGSSRDGQTIATSRIAAYRVGDGLAAPIEAHVAIGHR